MDKPTTEPSDSFIGLRVPTEIHDRFRELAKVHRRKLSEEVKWAMIVFDLQVTLSELMHPEAKAQMGADAHAAAVAEVKRDLHEFMAAALAGKQTTVEDREPVLH
jgi:hypothetical protein